MLDLALLLACLLQDPAPNALESGDVRGAVLDARGAPVEHALVVACDASSGLPLGAGAAHAPVGGPSQDVFDWWCARTDATGAFHFADAPVGELRLVAQSFPDLEEQGRAPERALDVQGLAVHLRGIAEHVAVTAGGTTQVELRPLGDASFVYHRGAGNDDWYMVLSAAPPGADPVLGPAGWDADFRRGALGWVRMKHGHTLVRGLPAGIVHFTIFANDSNPCFGAGAFRARSQEIAVSDENLVGGWSDARHDPPERLRALTEQVARFFDESGREAFERLLDQGVATPEGAPPSKGPYARLFAGIERVGPLTRELELPWGGTATVADVLAAAAYAHLSRGR